MTIDFHKLFGDLLSLVVSDITSNLFTLCIFFINVLIMGSTRQSTRSLSLCPLKDLPGVEKQRHLLHQNIKVEAAGEVKCHVHEVDQRKRAPSPWIWTCACLAWTYETSRESSEIFLFNFGDFGHGDILLKLYLHWMSEVKAQQSP